MSRILEGIVTTLDSAGIVNIAPMGPRLENDGRRIILRPFKTSKTYANLRLHPEGVLHVTDDVLLLARAAIGPVDDAPLEPAQGVKGRILTGACRALEFRVETVDEREERVTMEAGVIRTRELRPFFGLNRAKHAVVEAAILATRVHLLAREELLVELQRLEPLVAKTGGPEELEAFVLLRRHIEAAPPRGPRPGTVRVTTGSRLHFGLIAPRAGAGRRFGGAGLMVEEPRFAVAVSRSCELSAAGPLADRALAFARGLTEDGPAIRVEVETAPPCHSGLGTGTQLALAIARGRAALLGETWDASRAARTLGRGLRSAIGVHGFEQGGLLVDGGRDPHTDDALAPLLLRRRFPAAWRVLVVRPPYEPGLSGATEEAAFRGAPPEAAEALADRLARLLLLGLLPALEAEDLQAFGEALHDYGRLAGEHFREAQGGVFASPALTRVVEFLRSEGVLGVGQSSWGPSLFGLTDDEERARSLAARLSSQLGAGAPVIVTAARNAGARVQTS